MKTDDLNFREMYRQICLLSGEEIFDEVNLKDIFDFPPEEKLNGFLTYCHTDFDGALFFEILAGTLEQAGKIKTFPGSYKKNVRLKRGAVGDCEIKIVTGEYSIPFRDKIQMINDEFDVDDRKEKTRFVKSVDSLRHPDYPDDVQVFFFAENLNPEPAWLRCEKIDGNIFTGTLLTELNQDFGFKIGDEVKFGTAEFNGEIICVAGSKDFSGSED